MLMRMRLVGLTDLLLVLARTVPLDGRLGAAGHHQLELQLDQLQVQSHLQVRGRGGGRVSWAPPTGAAAGSTAGPEPSAGEGEGGGGGSAGHDQLEPQLDQLQLQSHLQVRGGR